MTPLFDRTDKSVGAAHTTRLRSSFEYHIRFTVAEVSAIKIENRWVLEVQKMPCMLDDLVTAPRYESGNHSNVLQVHNWIISAIDDQRFRIDAFESNKCAHIARLTAHEVLIETVRLALRQSTKLCLYSFSHNIG